MKKVIVICFTLCFAFNLQAKEESGLESMKEKSKPYIESAKKRFDAARSSKEGQEIEESVKKLWKKSKEALKDARESEVGKGMENDAKALLKNSTEELKALRNSQTGKAVEKEAKKLWNKAKGLFKKEQKVKEVDEEKVTKI